MDAGDHPEADESDLLYGDDIALYRMLIGCGQWAVVLGRFDVQYAVNTMARYMVAPRTGHLKRMLRIFGYLKHYGKAYIGFDISTPNYENVDTSNYNWSEQYPDATEEIPDDAPAPCNTQPHQRVYVTCYVDSDHAADVVTRRSVTGILLFVNNTPIKWYSKRQNTIETSSYGSELVAARIAAEMIMEFRYRLRMMGISLHGPSILMMDNKSVVINSTFPSSTLKKKHNSIAYHKVREAVAAGIIHVTHIRGANNIADILTKSVGPADYYHHLSTILYHRSIQVKGSDNRTV
jgi:hypothetical protein